MKRKRPIVAIDGPAGSGKTTVSRHVAERVGYMVLDTGALYRTVALAAQRGNVDVKSEAIGGFVDELVSRGAIVMGSEDDGTARIWLDGEDVTEAIRRPEMGGLASVVSAVPEVRAALLELQRTIAAGGGVVVEGRDIGSVVFPDAEAKFFLTASVEKRAERRHADFVLAGNAPSIEQVKQDVIERDQRDSQRAVAPLVQAKDAYLVDSSELSFEQVVERIVSRVQEIERRLGAAP
ncbi:MAG: (d)CMP kinase [Polyangiaceae bacterium]